jgi:hypothetical protein
VVQHRSARAKTALLAGCRPITLTLRRVFPRCARSNWSAGCPCDARWEAQVDQERAEVVGEAAHRGGVQRRHLATRLRQTCTRHPWCSLSGNEHWIAAHRPCRRRKTASCGYKCPARSKLEESRQASVDSVAPGPRPVGQVASLPGVERAWRGLGCRRLIRPSAAGSGHAPAPCIREPAQSHVTRSPAPPPWISRPAPSI